jgi:RNA polymerase sigma factor (sigma-70 family)
MMMKTGSPKAFEELRGRYWYTLQAASGRLQDDLDWMQEAQTLLFELAKNWNPSSGLNFDATLYGLIWQRSDKYYYEHHRKHRRMAGDAPSSEPGADTTQEQEAGLDRQWLRKRLRLILKAYLDETDQEIIYLTFYKNRTQQQIAQKLGIKQQSVQERLTKALQKLKHTPHISALRDVLAS